MNTDTIFALATPPGKSGIAIIRLSGPHAASTLQKLGKMQVITPRVVHYAVLTPPVTGKILDHGIALYFKAPHSFTGEDIVELHVHGSLAVIHEVLGTLAQVPGLRPAEPGEFS